jgi:hypothetical protein
MPEWMNWKVTGRPQVCPDCQKAGFVIYDHEGRVWGCRPTHAQAMATARKKARHWADYLRRTATVQLTDGPPHKATFYFPRDVTAKATPLPHKAKHRLFNTRRGRWRIRAGYTDCGIPNLWLEGLIVFAPINPLTSIPALTVAVPPVVVADA